jgi:hypothetical protein
MFHDIDINIDHDLLEEHRVTAIALKEIKAKELDLRNQITDKILDGLEPGTHNFASHGMLIKAVKSLNYSFDRDVLQQLIDDEMLTEEEEELIRWKPELKLADYKKANFETEVLEEALFVKPAQPTLEIKIGE